MSKCGKFLLGLGTGIGLGIMFAPKKGSETRKELKGKCDDLIDKVKTVKPEDVKDTITEKLTALQNELKELDKEKVIEIAKQKGNDIKNKADELMKLAVEKGKPAVEKAAQDIKNSVAETLKNLAKKLETPTPSKAKSK